MSIENPCLQIGCWECCHDMVFLATGSEVYEFIKVLKKKLQTEINYRFVDFNSITGLLATELGDGEYEFIIAIKFKRDRNGRVVVPTLEDLKDSKRQVRLFLNGECPALDEVGGSVIGKQCSIHENEDRLPACGNFSFCPECPGSSCHILRSERI